MAVVKRIGSLWRPNLFFGVLFGFLLGRALPESQSAPLGIAFYAAVRGASFGPLAALPVGLAVVAGSGVWAGDSLGRLLWVGAALWAAHFGATALGVGTKGSSPLGAAVVAGLSSTLATVPLFVNPPYPWPEVALWIAVACLLAPIFTLGILDVTSGSLFRSGVGDSPLPVAVMIAGAVCGLNGLTLFHVLSLPDMAAGVVALAFAYVGGASLGAAAGAVLGAGFLVNGMFPATATPIPPDTHSMAYVMAGLLAGAFRDLRKGGVGISFYLGFIIVLLTFGLNSPGVPLLTDSLRVVMVSGAAAVLLFWATPRYLLARLPAAFLALPRLPAKTRTEAAAGDSLPVVNRVRSLSHVLKEVSRAFQHVAAVEPGTTPDQSSAFDQTAERVCRTCSLHRHCWEKEFRRTYQAFTDLWAQADLYGSLPIQPPPPELEFCIYPTEVASTLNHLYDVDRSRGHWQRQLTEGKLVASDYVKNAAQILERFADETDGEIEQPHLPPVLKLVSGVARIAKRGSHISGDSYLAAPLGENRYLMVLSDGMGVGSEAAAQSRQCIQLLQEVLSAGFNTELAVNTVNSVMILRCGEDSFVTVDLALVDLGTGRVEFIKVGASPSFIKRGSGVTVVKQAAVPMGIINQVQVEPEFRLLRAGDMIVMLTDGIWDAGKDDADKERWILHHLNREQAADPEVIAEGLLARALELMPDAGDDMTVLVARVESGGRYEPEPQRPAADSWVPARRAPKAGEKLTNRPKR